MRPRKKNLILFVLNIAFWSANYFSPKNAFSMQARSGTHVSLEVDPPRFKLKVNGTLWTENNAVNGWVTAPLLLKMPRGLYTVALERPGYSSHMFKLAIDGPTATPIKTSLERHDAAKNIVEISGLEIDDDELRVSVDGGFEEGNMPLILDDLLPGQHELEIRKTGLSSFRSKPMTCTFTISPQKNLAKTKIDLSLSGRKITASPNCRRTKIAH
jgi:hypothetical protein